MGQAAIPALISGGSSLLGAEQGADASKAASREQILASIAAIEQQEALGREAADVLRSFGAASQGELEAGSFGALDELAAARGLFSRQQAIGDEAFEALQNAILRGEGLQDLVSRDPVIGFEREAGERALARAAAAQGALGSGASIADFLQLNQNLATRGVDRALQRLGGLTDIGRDADVRVANLRGQSSGVRERLGSNLAAINQSVSQGIASALRGVATSSTPLQQNIASASAAGAAALPSAFSQVLPQLGGIAAGAFGAGGGTAAPSAFPSAGFDGGFSLGASSPAAPGPLSPGVLTPPSIPGLGGI